MMGSTICGSASRLADTPATSDFVSRGTNVLVNNNRIELNLYLRQLLSQSMQQEAHPLSEIRPPCLPPSARVKATAPPRTDTALSIPLGLPWRTFSARKA
jgi:hypothetical protein